MRLHFVNRTRFNQLLNNCVTLITRRKNDSLKWNEIQIFTAFASMKTISLSVIAPTKCQIRKKHKGSNISKLGFVILHYRVDVLATCLARIPLKSCVLWYSLQIEPRCIKLHTGRLNTHDRLQTSKKMNSIRTYMRAHETHNTCKLGRTQYKDWKEEQNGIQEIWPDNYADQLRTTLKASRSL